METLASAWALIVWAAVVMAGACYWRLRLPARGRPVTARTAAMLAAAVAVAGAEVAVASWHGRFGLGLLLAGPLFCLVLAVASVAAELAVRPSTAGRRRATLASRRPLDYVERSQLVAVATAFVAAVVFLGIAAFFGDPDDKGRPGRFLSLRSLDERYGWSTLWPGAYYGVPLLVALAVTLVVVGAALRWIAARPRPDPVPGTGTAAEDPVAADEDARRSSAEVVLAAGGVAAAAALCGAGLVAASGLTPMGFPWNVIGMALWVVVAGVAAIGAWSAAVLVTPDRTRPPHPAPATA